MTHWLIQRNHNIVFLLTLEYFEGIFLQKKAVARFDEFEDAFHHIDKEGLVGASVVASFSRK